VKNEDYRLFFWAMNERNFKFVKVGRLMNEVVEFVFGSRVLDVVEDGVENINTESPWSQLLIESGIDDSFENRDHCSELVGVRGDLSNGLVDAEMEARLYLEGLQFLPDGVNHLIKLVKVLFMELDDVSM
jgi:hypothetical protein